MILLLGSPDNGCTTVGLFYAGAKLMSRLNSKRSIALYCVLALLLFSNARTDAGTSDHAQKIARSIRLRYQSKLYSFDPDTQRHFAARMYRATGKDKYLFPIIFDACLAREHLREDIERYDDSEYRQARLEQLMEQFSPKSRKGRLRRAYFQEDPEAVWYLNVLYGCSKLYDYGLAAADDSVLVRKTLTYLRRYDFRSLLLDTALIRIFSAQAVNYVYYLYDLGLDDMRWDYERTFRQLFRDSLDDSLGTAEYRDKVYGLTHFILAESRYYQQTVDAGRNRWILDYFESHLERILDRTTADIVAEVGICFLLAEEPGSPVVKKTRQHVMRRFDKKHRMILSPHGRHNLARGEHRNILAILLLNWPPVLYPGPKLPQQEAYRKLFIQP